MSEEIWSIALTHDGLGACALDADMNRREFAVDWPATRQSGIKSVDTAAVLRTVAKALHFLSEESADPPIALALVSPQNETAVFVDGYKIPASPVFLEEPLTLPWSAIPDCFASNPVTASAFRNSVIRRIQQTNPTFGLNGVFGVWSLGALVMHALTGHPVSVCAPRGMVQNIHDYDDDSKALIFQAMGVDEKLSSVSIRPGRAAARISPQIVSYLNAQDYPELERLTGIPVFDMGNSEGAFAYAVGANPISCAVSLGWNINTRWNAGVSALSAYEIQILDKKSEQKSPEMDDKSREMTADEWTLLFNERCTLERKIGPGKNRMTYGWSRPGWNSPILLSSLNSLLDPMDGRIPFKELSRVPLGSCGLHLYCTVNGWRMAGLTASHEQNHLARALFEGLVYELREWLDTVNPDGAKPVRICMGKPWPVECAQWVADILNENVYFIDNGLNELAAFGSALALMRSFDLQDLKSPHLQAVLVEPTERAAYYRPHYEVHCLLKEN